MKKDILLINGLLFSPESGESQGQTRHYIKIAAGIIQDIGPMDQCRVDDLCPVVDASGCLMLPGLINGHCHGAMTLFRGLADDLELMNWLENHIFPAEAKCVTPEMVYWSSKLAAAEMIRGGITTVADGYFYEDAAARAFADSGMRAVAAHGVVDFPAPGVPDPALKFQVVSDFIDQWQGHERIVPAVFAHSPYTCGPETLQAAKVLARSKGCLFFMHLAETKQESEGIKTKTGLSPVRYLQSLDILDGSSVCVHGVWLDAEDIALLAEKNTKVITCPESNMKLASGIAPVKELVETGVCVGIGTDGAASNNTLNILQEMGSCMMLQKVSGGGAPFLSEKHVFEMATSKGAQVLGLEKSIGSLEPGKRADVVLVDMDQFGLMKPFDSYASLVCSASGVDVKMVIINGEVVMDNREIVSFDEKEAMSRVRRLAEKVRG